MNERTGPRCGSWRRSVWNLAGAFCLLALLAASGCRHNRPAPTAGCPTCGAGAATTTGYPPITYDPGLPAGTVAPTMAPPPGAIMTSPPSAPMIAPGTSPQ